VRITLYPMTMREQQGRIRGPTFFDKAADAAPRSAGHLRWLRDRLGERFVAGVVLHTGPRVYALDDRVLAAPISTIWG
jgi:hypothetical protein